MATHWTDFLATTDELPDPWMSSVSFIHQAGAARNSVEAEKLKNEMLLVGTQVRLSLYLETQREARATSELKAAELRAAASDQIARSLRTATWVLAIATIALVAATVVLAVRGG